MREPIKKVGPPRESIPALVVTVCMLILIIIAGINPRLVSRVAICWVQNSQCQTLVAR